MKILYDWLLFSIPYTTFLIFLLYFFRKIIIRYFMKSVDHSFDKKIEKFKGELRESEKEIEQIRTFLISAKSHADLAVQTKRIDAAENLLQNLNILSQFSPVIEVLRSIHIDKALQYGSGTNNDFFNSIIDNFKVDDKIAKIEDIDKTTRDLYLSEKTLNAFYTYQDIIMYGILTLKILGMPMENRAGIMKASDIDKKIIQLLPDTKAGFEKFGYKYAYYQLTTIYRMIVKELRREISGDDYRDSNLEFLKRTVLDTYHVQSETQKIMDESSLPKDLIQDTLTEQDKV